MLTFFWLSSVTPSTIVFRAFRICAAATDVEVFSKALVPLCQSMGERTGPNATIATDWDT